MGNTTIYFEKPICDRRISLVSVLLSIVFCEELVYEGLYNGYFVVVFGVM